MKAGLRWLPVGIAMLLLGAGAYWLAGSYATLFPDPARLLVDPNCDLRAGRCDRRLPGGGVLGFSIVPRDLPLMEPLTLRATIEGRDVDGVLVDIVGLNMEMGLNRTRLERGADHVWHGETLLPVCARKLMEWEAAVWLEDDGIVLAVPYRFATTRQ